MALLINCKTCEKPVKVYPCQTKKQFCSKACKGIKQSTAFFKKCIVCSSEFKTSPWRYKNGHRFCGVSCQNLGLIKKTKRCPACKVEKPREAFGELNNGVTKTTGLIRYRCKECANAHLRQYRKQFKAINNMQYEAHLINSSEKYFKYSLNRAFNNSKNRKDHSEFNLTQEFISTLFKNQNGLCAITGEPMTMTLGKGRLSTNMSIDRIDSSKPYIQNNVQLVTTFANLAKNNMSMVDFVNFCKKVLKQASNIGGKQIGMDKET